MLIPVVAMLLAPCAFGQASVSAQLRGLVKDPAGAAVPAATVTVTNEATNTSEKVQTDDFGRYIFNALRPDSYNVRVEAAGFKTVVHPHVVLRVAQQVDVDFTLEVGSVTSTVEVVAIAPLLNSVSAALGQEVENRYVTEVPLLDRDIANLAFLAPGVTEVQNATNFTGINFVSNGQRNSTAEVRMDGALTSSPDEAGGGVLKAYYRPSPEIVQEFKLQNNSFSAEYGNNGGTVINLVTKSGTNQFHGSGYYFLRRPELDANSFFANRAGEPKSDYKKDIYGGSIGGPIIKNRTFFFFDYDRTRFDAPNTTTTSVPTDLQKKGDFSQTFNPDGSLMQIFNPFDTYTDASGNPKRRPLAGNVVPASMFDPIAIKLTTFFPEPTGPGDHFTGLNNFTKSANSSDPTYQYDIKIDHMFSSNSRLNGRYSRRYQKDLPAKFYDNPSNGFYTQVIQTQNAVIEHTWAVNSSTVWVNRIGVDRVIWPRSSARFDPTSIGLPSILKDAMGISIFPRVEAENYLGLGTTGWTDSNTPHTMYQLASSLSKVTGPHNLKFGGEIRPYYSAYFQPGFPGGFFQFNHLSTAQDIFNPDPTQGNGLASLLLGFGDPYSWGGLNIQPSTATHSKETAFFAQDDWRVTQRLTVNMGLRYEWSSPYTMRHDLSQIADFTADTAIDVPGVGRIHGMNQFVNSHHRTISTDWNNIGPRLGFAFRVAPKTVLRAGAGVYYSINITPSTWLVGPAYRKYVAWHTTLDGGITRFGTLENPFPNGLAFPQGKKYGNQNMWGLSSDTDLNEGLRNPEIYQWNVGVQHQLTSSTLIEVAYSASRGTHLEFAGTNNRNILQRADREKWGTEGLQELVPNPFQPLFSGPNAIFNEPDSIYNNATIPRANLLRPYPQFDGGFSGNLKPIATSRYNSLQLRFEKRYSHGLNFVGSYTYSKLTDDSSSGNNNWVGNSASIQDITNLRAERSIGASDTPHRLVFGGSYELPVGRGKPLGANVNRVFNTVIGGWQVNGFLTFQSGNPIALYSYNPLADGSQRPNISGNPRSHYSIKQVVDGTGNFFNQDAITAPPPQHVGNAPRFSSNLRGDTIRNLDASLFKNFTVREQIKLQLRGEFFNFTNRTRFSLPGSSLGNPSFGTVTSQLNSPRIAQMGVRFLW